MQKLSFIYYTYIHNTHTLHTFYTLKTIYLMIKLAMMINSVCKQEKKIERAQHRSLNQNAYIFVIFSNLLEIANPVERTSCKHTK